MRVLVLVPLVLMANIPSVATFPPHWRVDLSATGTAQDNIVHTVHGITLAAGRHGTRSAGGGRRYGFYVSPVIPTDQPLSSLRLLVTAERPPDSTVSAEARGRDSSGNWSEWRESTITESRATESRVTEARATEATEHAESTARWTARPKERVYLPSLANALQLRITLTTPSDSSSPTVFGLQLT